MAVREVLITVKTYPTLSSKYEELVCTAGVFKNGDWVRIYPVQFRQKPYAAQYSKYDWIKIDLVKNKKDFRPESFRPLTHDTDIEILGKVGTKNKWEERKKYILKNIYTDLSQLISDAMNPKKYTSLATFKPSIIHDFIWEEAEREWPDEKLAQLRQGNLFEERSGELQLVKKLPYKFSYVFEDDNGRQSTLMNEDWEVGALYWNCLKRNSGDEQKALIDVREKFLDEFVTNKDLYVYLGTTLQWHRRKATNPFVIIGTFYPPKENQMSFDFD